MNAITRSAAAQRRHGADWNPYDILGLVPPASDKQIRAAYRQLAKVLHSDVTGDDEAFLVVKEAHDFLLDPIARGLWDRMKLRATPQMKDAAIRNLRALCAQIVDQLINGMKPPEYADIPAMMRHDLARRLGELEHAKRRTEGVIRRTRLLEGKVKRKGKGDNIVAAVLAGRIAEAEKVLEGITREQEIGEIMRAELEAYSSTATEEARAAWQEAADFAAASIDRGRGPTTSFFTFTMSRGDIDARHPDHIPDGHHDLLAWHGPLWARSAYREVDVWRTFFRGRAPMTDSIQNISFDHRRALEIGSAGEHLVCADLLLQGYRAFQSSQGAPYDVVVELDGKLVRITVKSTVGPRRRPARPNSRGIYQFGIGRSKRNNKGKTSRTAYSSDDVDVVAMVALDTKVIAYEAMLLCPTTMQFSASHGQARESVHGPKTSEIRRMSDYTFSRALRIMESADA